MLVIKKMRDLFPGLLFVLSENSNSFKVNLNLDMHFRTGVHLD